MVAPVARHEWNRVVATLESTSRALRPAATNRIAARRPLEVLMRMRIPPLTASGQDNPLNGADGDGDPGDSAASLAEWQRLARLPSLWYVRRRNLAGHDDLAGIRRWVAGGSEQDESAVHTRLQSLGLGAELEGVLGRATPKARVEITSLLGSPRLQASPALTAVAIGELKRLDAVDHAGALKAASAVTEPEAGAGLARMERNVSDLAEPATLRRLADNPAWKSIDQQARRVDRGSLATLTQSLQRP